MDQVKLLPTEFIGRGEVRGFRFKQIYSHNNFYVYQVSDESDQGIRVYYELIKRYAAFSTFMQQMQECYPSSKMFGIKAWTYPTLKRTEEGIEEHFSIKVNIQNL